MIEQTIIEYLQPLLEVPVSTQKREDHPARYVIVERTGGGMENHIRSAMIAVQAYGATQVEAAELHEEIIDLMLSIIGLPEICACDLNAEYNFTDETTKEYRYQSVYDVVYY